jgi:hypothetical protein
MGIIFSDTIDKEVCEKKEQNAADGLFSKTIIERGKLRLSGENVQKLVETYANHYYLPISGRAELWSLFSTVSLLLYALL